MDNKEKNKKEERKERVAAILKKLMAGEITGDENKAPAFQLYVQDFLVGTMHLSGTDIGSYILVLCYQWDKWGLPNDPEKLTRIGKCTVEVINNLMDKFKVCPDGKLRNRKLESIRAEQMVNRKVKSVAGNKGNEIRWGKKEQEQEEKETEAGPFSKPGLQKISLEHLDNTQKLEALARRYKVDINKIREWLDEFKSKRENDEREYMNISDLRFHFDSFCGKKAETPGKVSKKERDKCPYTDDQLRIADAQKASGLGTPEWFDKKWIHLLRN